MSTPSPTTGNQCYGVASWSQHGAWYAPEACYGDKPQTPLTLKALRKVTFSPTLAREAVKSGEVRPDRLDGLTGLGNNNVTAELAGELSYNTYDDFFEALLCGTWTGDVVHAGIKRRSFYLWEKFNDIQKNRETSGIEINTLSMSVGINTKVELTWGMTGTNLDYPSAIPSDYTFGVPTTGETADTFTGVITVKGTQVAVITSIELSVDNGIEPLHVLFAKVAKRSSINPIGVSGTMGAYFDDDSLLKMFINGDRFETEFTLNMDGGKYTFRLPNCIFTEGNTETGAGNIPINLSFVADHDETSPLYITRASFATPAFTTQPTDQTVTDGDDVTFTVAADHATEYRWEKSIASGVWSTIQGETGTTLTFTTAASDNGNKYRAVAINHNAIPPLEVASNEATLTVS